MKPLVDSVQLFNSIRAYSSKVGLEHSQFNTP